MISVLGEGTVAGPDRATAAAVVSLKPEHRGRRTEAAPFAEKTAHLYSGSHPEYDLSTLNPSPDHLELLPSPEGWKEKF